jgi:hypothetical protein
MITVEEAYAAGPDGVVDVSPGSVFRQYMAQQEASLANMRATTQLSPELQYMAANPDVLGHATRTAAAEGIAPGADFGARTQQIAAQHFMDFGAEEGRNGFGLPLSTVGQPPPVTTMPINTAPFNPMPPSGGSTTPSISTMPGATMSFSAPLPGQLPGYSFTANPNQYANNLGTFGGLLDDTSPFYAGQVPVTPPPFTPQPSGYNFAELARYPNANYSAGVTPIIYTY